MLVMLYSVRAAEFTLALPAAEVSNQVVIPSAEIHHLAWSLS